MEWLILIGAAILGGIGNGLAGISAATVLVPVLIVLCPTFAGEAGAFQATTLALTCDILSSAVTSAVYVRHGNIDLKRGWIMLVCVWAMSIAGSIAAWAVGGAVLGGFCLILTFCIGIRYLVKPESDERDEPGGRAGGLSAKTIAVSVFFGLTIGFGTGFVGTGGGMMMFIVFTAFLGYSSRKAVGTATFIMTGTALIASIAHYLIDATLLVEHLDIVVVCTAIATITSLFSARFANRVEGKVVGLTTGVILTVLGGAMIVLNYHDFFAMLGGRFLEGLPGGLTGEGGLLEAIALCLLGYLRFLVPAVIVLLIVKVLARNMPREVFRKLLHAVAFCSGIILAYSTNSWQAAACASALFAIVVYPLLALAERWSGFSALFNERRAGEVKTSLLLLFGVSALVIVLCWGVGGHRSLIAAVLLTWGVGDAAVGLIGRRFGKHKTGLRIADPNKTWEGTLAFAVAGFATCFIALAVAGAFDVSSLVGVSDALGSIGAASVGSAGNGIEAANALGATSTIGVLVLKSAIAAVIGAFAELVSRNGNDTVIVPVALCAVLLALP